MTSTTGTFTMADGTTRLTRQWAAESPWASMLLVHGLGEHSGRYEVTGADFAAAGITVHSFDQRGHGETERPGHVDAFDQFLDDVAEQLTVVRGDGLPTVLLGHSLGGLIAFDYTVSDRHAPDLLVLSAPALAANVPGIKKLAAKLLSRILPTLAIPNEISGEQLSSDPAVGEAYFTDPLVYTKTTARLGAEIFAAMDWAQQSMDRLDVPTFVIHGTADTVVPPTASAPLADLPGVERRLLPGFRHESFNEVDRDQAVGAVVDWLRAKVQGAAGS